MQWSKGVQYMLQATVYYAGMNLCIKYLEHIPAHQVIFIRSIVTFVITLYFIRQQRVHPWGNNKSWLVLRGLAGFAGLLCYVVTVQHIPLASAVTIQNLSPVFTLMIAHFMLDDELRLRNWIFTFISLTGVFLVKGFDERISNGMLALGIFSALMSGLAYSCIRKVNQSDHALVIVFYFPLVTLPFVTPYTLTHWTTPSMRELGEYAGSYEQPPFSHGRCGPVGEGIRCYKRKCNKRKVEHNNQCVVRLIYLSDTRVGQA